MVKSLTEGLVHLIREKPVTNSDLYQTALSTLDAIANTVAGKNSVPGRKLLEWGQNRLHDRGRRAFVMGGLTHILEVDDLHRASVMHTGCVTVPVALALAADQNISGKKLLRSILYGFEAASRVGMAVGSDHYKVWHNTATCGPFGSAMTAATLLDLTDKQTMFALGNAGTQSAGLWEFLETGAMSKHLHAGRAAEAGLVAAELAGLDFSGPPAILEGKAGLFAGACPNADPDAVLRNPDEAWQVHLTSIKPWPSCRHTHPAIDASLELANQVDNAEIESVKVNTYGAALDVCNRALVNSEYEAKFSLQHCVSIALMGGKIDFSSFDTNSRNNTVSLMEKVHLNVGEPYASAYPKSWGAGVCVTLKNDKTLVASKPECKGDPEAPLSEKEMIGKAKELLRFGGVREISAIIDGVMGLTDGESLPDFSELLMTLR